MRRACDAYAFGRTAAWSQLLWQPVPTTYLATLSAVLGQAATAPPLPFAPRVLAAARRRAFSSPPSPGSSSRGRSIADQFVAPLSSLRACSSVAITNRFPVLPVGPVLRLAPSVRPPIRIRCANRRLEQRPQAPKCDPPLRPTTHPLPSKSDRRSPF